MIRNKSRINKNKEILNPKLKNSLYNNQKNHNKLKLKNHKKMKA